MDVGHHNCRDYHLNPDDIALKPDRPSKPVSTASILAARASQKSPLSHSSHKVSPFPFLQLPLELRRQIYGYLLPCTQAQDDTRCILHSINSNRCPPTHHNLPPDVVQRLLANPAAVAAGAAKESVIWRRGQTALLVVCRQFHDECAALLYGESTFVIFVAYDSITFRFIWSLSNGLTPNRTYDFLELIRPRYLKFIKRLVVTVDHVDSYTGQIKYNVGGKGLTHGLRGQVAKLVRALKIAAMNDVTSSVQHDDNVDNREGGRGANANSIAGHNLAEAERASMVRLHRGKSNHGIKRVTIKLLNGNDHLDIEKKNLVKARGDSQFNSVKEVQTVLEPIAQLRGLVDLEVTGAVTKMYTEYLRMEALSSR